MPLHLQLPCTCLALALGVGTSGSGILDLVGTWNSLTRGRQGSHPTSVGFPASLGPQDLGSFGTNFSMIEEYFPRRTRRQIKNKFVKEEISNRKLINWAIIARTGMGLNQFNEYLEKKYSNNKLGINKLH